MQENVVEGKGDRTRKIFYSVLLLGLIAGFFLVPRLVGVAFSPQDEFIPIPLHAAAIADYSADGLYLWQYSADSSLIAEAIRDREPAALDAADRVWRIVRGFDTPVPTITPVSLWGEATEAGGSEPTPPVDSTPTADVSDTPGPSPTATSTFTPGPSPTETQTTTRPPILPSSTPTRTPHGFISPTPTRTTTLTTLISPTTTQVTITTTSATTSNTPPTISSPTSTHTPAPSPSLTSTTPASGDVCSSATLSNFSVGGLNVSWTLTNNGTGTIMITETFINWPSSNEELIKVYLGGSMVWDETDESPPTTLGSDWEGGSRAIASGMSKVLKFEFDVNAASSGYSLVVTLNSTCQINAGG